MKPLAFALLLSLASAAHAQGSFGIGGQVGTPTGLTIKLRGASSLDFAAGWNDDRVFLQGHYLLAERRLPASGTDLRTFYGPGLFVRIRDNDGGDDQTDLGLSFNAGLAVYTGPVEIFGQLTPRLRLTNETDFDLGAALGLRFYP